MKKLMREIIVFSLFLVLSPLSAWALELISTGVDGVPGNNGSGHETMSKDGRYVVFFSEASNLVSGDTNNVGDVFVFDRQLGTMERVSVDSNGNEGNGRSSWPSISADGRYIAFKTKATNLSSDFVPPVGIYIHDRETGVTELVDLSPYFIIPDARHSVWIRLSDDGGTLLVKFENLAVEAGLTNTLPDILIVDLATGDISGLPYFGNADSFNGGPASVMARNSMSSNGNRIVYNVTETFQTRKGGTIKKSSVNVYDRSTDTVYVVSDKGAHTNASISADGNWVAFSDGNSKVFVKSYDGSQSEKIRIESWAIALALSETGRFVTTRRDWDRDGVLDQVIYDRETKLWQPVGTADAGFGDYGYFELTPSTQYAAWSSIGQVYIYDRWVDFPSPDLTLVKVKGGGKKR